MINYHESITQMYNGNVVQFIGTVNGNIFTDDGAKFCMQRGVVFDYPSLTIQGLQVYDPDFRYKLTGETVDTSIWPKQIANK